MERITQNTLALAKWLQKHPKVESVSYPGLEGDPNHASAKKYLKNGFGGVLSFSVKGNLEQTKKVVESLELVSHLANVGDVRTLIIQPAAATTHSQLSATEQISAGVYPNSLRVSLGIEHIDDLIGDFEQAFSQF